MFSELPTTSTSIPHAASQQVAGSKRPHSALDEDFDNAEIHRPNFKKKKTDKRQLKNDEVGRAFLVERGSTLRKARDDRDQKAAQLEDKKEKKKVDTAAKRELKKRQKECPGRKETKM
jgi:hypothetical protein